MYVCMCSILHTKNIFCGMCIETAIVIPFHTEEVTFKDRKK
jgi:hypothetical protein